jgi:hypothetical protein
MSDIKYKTYSRDLILGQEAVLKTIFIKIFNDLYQSLKKCCSIDPNDLSYLDDLIFFHEDMDLIDATKLYRQKFFKHQKLIKFNNIKFSIQEINSILNTTRFQERMAKKNIVDSIEMRKPYKFNLLAMEEVSRIASELTNIRHMIAHNNNLNQSSQALILMGNISRLLSITPDSIRDTTSGFSELEKFISINFFDSIIEIVRPDIEENRFTNHSVDKDIQEAILMDKIDEMSSQLNELNEIKLVVSQNQKISDDIKSNFKTIRSDLIDEIKNLNINLEPINPSDELESKAFDSSSLQVFSSNEVESENKNLSSPQEFKALMGGPRWSQNPIDEPNQDGFLDNTLPEHKKNKINVEDLELVYSSYQNAINDGIEKRKVVTWIINDLDSSYGLTTEDLTFTKSLVDEGLISNSIYDNYLMALEEEDSLSRSELYDKLMALRVEIKNRMRNKSKVFQNWHNILMVALAHEIIDNRIINEEDFRNNKVFLKYYHSDQMPESLQRRDDVFIIKQNAQDLMNTQINEYWDEISNLVKKLS